jgi:hypothetical protein
LDFLHYAIEETQVRTLRPECYHNGLQDREVAILKLVCMLMAVDDLITEIRVCRDFAGRRPHVPSRAS